MPTKVRLRNGKEMPFNIGDELCNIAGEKFTIVDYKSAMKIRIKFEDGSTREVSAVQIRKGVCGNPRNNHANGRKITVKVGDIFTNNEGAVAEVIKYNNSQDVIVKFLRTGYILSTQSSRLLLDKGFKDPYHPTIFGVGYFGNRSSYENLRSTEYGLWYNMLRRCYGNKDRDVIYNNILVEEYLHSFENFYDFITTKDGFKLGYQMDKDLLSKDTIIYSRSTITFLPKIINTAIQGGKRGVKEGLPVGVFYRKENGKYRAISGEYGRLVNLGHYDNPSAAFKAYKQSKERYLKELAETYKETLEEAAYNALVSYEVKETD